MRRGIGRLRAGGGGFNPLSLFAVGDLGAWYDPSDLSTLFQDSAGTTPVTATTQPVGKMLDKSGRGNHLTQATTTARPTLQQDGGGFYCLNLDGVDDALGGLAWTINQPSTVVTGVSIASIPSTNNYVYDGTTGRQALFIDSLGRPTTFAGGSVVGAAMSTATPYVIQSFYNGASSQQRVNKTAITSGDAGAQASSGFGIGGFNAGTGFYLAHKNYGLIFISRTLTSAERDAVDAYMGRKMGIVL